MSFPDALILTKSDYCQDWKPIDSLIEENKITGVVKITDVAKLIWDYELQLEMCLQENNFLVQNMVRMEKGLEPIMQQDFSEVASKTVYSLLNDLFTNKSFESTSKTKMESPENTQSSETKLSLLQVCKPIRDTNQDNLLSLESFQKQFQDVMESKIKAEVESEINQLKKQVNDLTLKSQTAVSIQTATEHKSDTTVFMSYTYDSVQNKSPYSSSKTPPKFFQLPSMIHELLEHSKESGFTWSTEDSIARDKWFHEKHFNTQIQEMDASKVKGILDRTCRNLGLWNVDSLPNAALAICTCLIYTKKILSFIKKLSLVTGTDDWDMMERLIRTWRSLVLKADNYVVFKNAIQKAITSMRNVLNSPCIDITDLEINQSDETLVVQFNELHQKLLMKYYSYSSQTHIMENTKDQDFTLRYYNNPFKSIVDYFMKVFTINDVDLCKVAIDRLNLKMRESTKFFRGVLNALNIPNTDISPAEVLSFISGLYKQYSRAEYNNNNKSGDCKIVRHLITVFKQLQSRLKLPNLPDVDLPSYNAEDTERDLLSSNSSSTVYSQPIASPISDPWKLWSEECFYAIDALTRSGDDFRIKQRPSAYIKSN